jgi:hypothetical protein
MASSERTEKDDGLERQIKPSNNLFFLDEHIVRYISKNKGMNIVYLFDTFDQKEKTMLWSDFKKHRRRAYTLIDTARLLDRGPAQIYRYIDDGLIPPPVGAQPGGKRMFTKKSYYSEDHIFQIREVMSTIHRGRPRNDGKICNNVLTEQELRARMGDALMLYTRTKDGEFIPVWSEQTY